MYQYRVSDDGLRCRDARGMDWNVGIKCTESEESETSPAGVISHVRKICIAIKRGGANVRVGPVHAPPSSEPVERRARGPLTERKHREVERERKRERACVAVAVVGGGKRRARAGSGEPERREMGRSGERELPRIERDNAEWRGGASAGLGGESDNVRRRGAGEEGGDGSASETYRESACGTSHERSYETSHENPCVVEEGVGRVEGPAAIARVRSEVKMRSAREGGRELGEEGTTPAGEWKALGKNEMSVGLGETRNGEKKGAEILGQGQRGRGEYAHEARLWTSRMSVWQWRRVGDMGVQGEVRLGGTPGWNGDCGRCRHQRGRVGRGGQTRAEGRAWDERG
ncbi:hypothetical protein C8R44DRAFT_934177 [Mycena epipterygia]|nr:hypothetical protein C8R44DRAFT_934177 [Mycena epipterygia]